MLESFKTTFTFTDISQNYTVSM